MEQREPSAIEAIPLSEPWFQRFLPVPTETSFDQQLTSSEELGDENK